MSMHCGYIVKVKELKPHNNADKLQLATFFGESVCVDLEVKIGDLGVYFPCDLQLSLEFCDANNLCRTKADGTSGSGYLDREKRNVSAIRLRGEKSYGIYLPLTCVEYTGVDLSTLEVGMAFTVLNGYEICQKYIPHSNPRGAYESGNRTRKKKVNIAPTFAEHADTEQLAYNLSAFHAGDEIEITLKMHGTSQRTGHLPVLKGYKRTFWDWLFRREGTPQYEYGYVSGTRRVVLESYEGGFYGDNSFREQHSKKFEGKLWAGETVYYEVVGFTQTGAPIMASSSNKKLNDKEFIKQYGEETVFSYGCRPERGWKDIQTDNEIPQSDIYVYRMTMTTPDGNVIEYTPDFMRYRSEQMGVKTVPVFAKFIIPKWPSTTEDCEPIDAGEYVKEAAEEYYNGPDPIGKTHVREGVVVRILNRPKFTAYKHKNFSFKVLEGIAKVEAEAPDMEELQEVTNDNI